MRIFSLHPPTPPLVSHLFVQTAGSCWVMCTFVIYICYLYFIIYDGWLRFLVLCNVYDMTEMDVYSSLFLGASYV
uniref:Uncharacterized protein n=1 Tax=Anguilla anguilla TaxID=7936 RepID=A0A0E9X2D7_ANGAN